MIYCIAKLVEEDHIGYRHGTFEQFYNWLLDLDVFQFDVETPPVDFIKAARFRTLQFGEYDPFKSGKDKVQWVIEWALLTNEQKIAVLKILNDKKRKKYIHNVAFEYQVLLNYNLVLENCIDTMLSEKIIFTGYSSVLDEDGATFYSLESVARRRLEVELDKTYQLLFGLEYSLTPGHIRYAAQDVTVLDSIDYQQQEMLERYYGSVPKEERSVYNHLPTLEWECALAFADMMYNGMLFDKEKWLKNASEAEPIVDKYKQDLNSYLFDDEALNQRALELKYIATEDQCIINWNSHQQKQKILAYAFPDLPGATKPVILKFIRDNPEYKDTAAGHVLTELVNGNPQPIQDMLMENCWDDLLKMKFVIPKGTVLINWNSSDQVLPLLRVINKRLQSTDEQSMNKLEHPIGFALLEYRGALKLLSSYGEKFLEHVNPDDRVRTYFNQILETGRVSSSKPNMQQVPMVPSDDPLEANKYRHAFIAPEGYSITGGDYSSQELAVIASMSQDPVWMEALKNGWDLHSICAALVHGKEWDKLTLDTCKFKSIKQKCKCPGHVRLRSGIKSISFGLAYGMSEFKLSSELKISVEEARKLMEKYFSTFPKIKGKLTTLGQYALLKGHILTLKPYFRIRWYPNWDKVKQYIEYHIKGIKHNPTLGSIERTGKNHPIQGSSADMCKLALVLIRRHITDNNLRNKVKLIMQIHDEILTECKNEYVETWQPVMKSLMESAAKVIIPSGLLKADVDTTPTWQK